MKLLDLRPGPDVGRAYKWLLELRLDSGPMSPHEAEAALKEWWAKQNDGEG